ncbi:MAG: prolipoprotein diacylglyceryl transferase [Mycobacterium sp.]|nr:prolipoprotein diacylglyceryl transferase [Mycobacterium sp.]
MTTTVLAFIPSPGQGVWYLGPVPIRAYALCIIAGIIASLVIGDRRWVARGGERGVVYDIALWAVPFGLIGGRLYHLMTDWRTYFGKGGAGIGAALRIWEGGLGIWGAIALGGVGAWIACRRRGIPLPAFGDAVAPGIVLAQAIGRLGNYFNQELYGRETTVPWGMEIFYRRDSSGVVDVHSLDGISTGQVAAVVHPTFLYELLWNLLVFVFLLYIDRKYRLGHGRLFALYVASYCVGRFWVELMRNDSATHIAGIRINVFTAGFVFIGAVVYMLLAPKGREDPATLRGREPDEERAVEELAGELAAVAKGSGILAAVTVAGDHEQEDAEAVGDDIDVDAEVDSQVDAEVEAEEAATEAAMEDEIAESGYVNADVTADEAALVIEAEPATDAEQDVLDEVESTVVIGDGDAVDEQAEIAEDDGPVVVYASAPEAESAEIVVLYESTATDEAVVEAIVEIETEAEAEPVVVVEAEAEPVVVVEAEAEPVVVVEAEAEPEVVVEPEPEPETEVVVSTEPEPEPEAVGFGSTLRRLLWGVGSKGGD